MPSESERATRSFGRDLGMDLDTSRLRRRPITPEERALILRLAPLLKRKREGAPPPPSCPRDIPMIDTTCGCRRPITKEERARTRWFADLLKIL